MLTTTLARLRAAASRCLQWSAWRAGLRDLTMGCLGFLLLAGTAAALQPEDLYDMRGVTAEDLSRDGRYLLYTVRSFDRQSGQGTAELRRRDLLAEEDLVLIDQQEYGAVAWRPDGTAIAVVLAGEDGRHLWIMDPAGGGRRQVSAESYGYGQLKWSGDGRYLAFISEAEVSSPQELPEDVVVAEQIGYRHLGDGYRQGRLQQLYTVDVATGQVRRLIDAAQDVRSFDWSPDGARLVLEAKREADLGVNLNSDLWLVDRDGSEARQLTFNPGPDHDPLWSEPGEIVYLCHADPINESAAQHIRTITDLEKGDRGPGRTAGEEFDNRIWKIYAGGRYFTGFKDGCIDLFRAGKQSPAVTHGGHDFWNVLIRGRTAVLTGSTQEIPSAIWRLNLAADSPADPQLLIDPNADWSRRVELFRPQRFTIEVEGRTIHGWYFLPEARTDGGPHPTVLSVHGGPEWMYGGYFLPEFHVLPERGYAVLIANPTGSTGYGLVFQEAIRGDWVGAPARDLLGCLDWAVAQGWADPERLAVMGGSYGGHLAAALTTQTDRFKAAAIDRMTCDLVSFWGTTDEKWFPEWEFLGRPWENDAQKIYHLNSPIHFVDHVSTPTLISHGLRDYRCLIGQAEAWFSALKVRQVPVRFLRFGNEGHGIRGRENQVFYLKELLAWFDRHVRGAGAPR